VGGGRDDLGGGVEEAHPAGLELRQVLGLEDQVPGVVRHGHVAERLLHLVHVDADGGVAPEPVDQVLVARIHVLEGLHDHRVVVLPVGQLRLVELLEQAALELHLPEVGGGHHDVVAGAAGHQLGVEDLVGVEAVVADLDAGLLLEVGDGVVGDVVGPVVDVEDLLLLGAGRCGGEERAGQREVTERGETAGRRGGHAQASGFMVRGSGRSWCGRVAGGLRRRASVTGSRGQQAYQVRNSIWYAKVRYGHLGVPGSKWRR
jgi:hypothetical protein